MLSFKEMKPYDYYIETVDEQPIDFSKRYDDQLADYVCGKKRCSAAAPQKMTGDEVRVYCIEGTPLLISSASSMCDLREVAPPAERQKEPENNQSAAEDTSGERVECAVQDAADSPLMFSRSSSVCSLNSFEQQSNVDDRSSSVSIFSTLASGIISPSEIPDSPGEAMLSPPFLPPIKQPPRFVFPPLAPQGGAGEEDMPRVYSEEGPLHSPMMEEDKTVLSPLEEIFSPPVPQEEEIQEDYSEESDTALRQECSASVLHETKDEEEGDSDEEELLKSCIQMGMPTNNNSSWKTKDYSEENGAALRQEREASMLHETKEEGDSDEEELLKSCIQMGMPTNNNSSSSWNTNALHLPDSTPAALRDYSVEKGALRQERNASVLQETKDEDEEGESDEEELLQSCIQMGMPTNTNSPSPWKTKDYSEKNGAALSQEHSASMLHTKDDEEEGDSDEEELLKSCIQMGMPTNNNSSSSWKTKTGSSKQGAQVDNRLGYRDNHRPDGTSEDEEDDDDDAILAACIRAGMPGPPTTGPPDTRSTAVPYSHQPPRRHQPPSNRTAPDMPRSVHGLSQKQVLSSLRQAHKDDRRKFEEQTKNESCRRRSLVEEQVRSSCEEQNCRRRSFLEEQVRSTGGQAAYHRLPSYKHPIYEESASANRPSENRPPSYRQIVYEEQRRHQASEEQRRQQVYEEQRRHQVYEEQRRHQIYEEQRRHQIYEEQRRHQVCEEQRRLLRRRSPTEEDRGRWNNGHRTAEHHFDVQHHPPLESPRRSTHGSSSQRRSPTAAAAEDCTRRVLLVQEKWHKRSCPEDPRRVRKDAQGKFSGHPQPQRRFTEDHISIRRLEWSVEDRRSSECPRRLCPPERRSPSTEDHQQGSPDDHHKRPSHRKYEVQHQKKYSLGHEYEVHQKKSSLSPGEYEVRQKKCFLLGPEYEVQHQKKYSLSPEYEVHQKKGFMGTGEYEVHQKKYFVGPEDATCTYRTEDTPVLSPSASASDLSALSDLHNSLMGSSGCSSDEELLQECIRSGMPQHRRG